MNDQKDSGNNPNYELLTFRIESVENSLDKHGLEIKTMLAEGFKQLHERINRIDSRIDKLDGQIDIMNTWQTGAEVRLMGIEAKLGEHKSDLSKIEEEFKTTQKETFQFTPKAIAALLGVLTVIVAVVSVVVSNT